MPQSTAGANTGSRIWLYILLAALVVAIALAIWFWRIAHLRPYIATSGAAIVALSGPALQVLSLSTWATRLLAGLIATLTAAGAWFATEDLQDSLSQSWRERARLAQEVRLLSEQRSQLSSRLTALTAATGAFIRERPNDQKQLFLLAAGQYQRTLYRTRQYWLILDFARVMLEVDPENGHGLYYAAEAHRHFARELQRSQATPNAADQDWFEMRDMLQKYLAASESHSDALTGAGRECYERAHGYCRERVAWANHLTALDALRVAAAASGEVKVESLLTAVRHADAELRLWPGGFEGAGTFPSSCQIPRIVARELTDLGRDHARADAVVAAHSAACSS